MAEGIILSGGLSSRAQTNKMLFMLKGEPLIMHTIKSMRPFVRHIIVVSGRYHDEISELLKNDQSITIVYNKDYEKGMFSSVLCGTRAISDKEDFFIIPGDCPFVKESTYKALLNGNGLIRVPTYKARSGHPLFLNQSLKPKLLQMSVDENLKKFRDEIGYQKIEVDDENILTDIDTIEDYQQLLDKKGNKK